VRNDRFGEFLLNIPALRALKETYPLAELTLAVDPAVSELAAMVEYADQVVIWDSVKRKLRGYKFDLAVISNPTKEAHRCIFLAGIPQRVGYDRKWGFLLTHKIPDTKDQGNRHEVECNLELVALAGAKTQDLSLAVRVNESLYKYFINQKIVIIHPFTSDPVKQWPIERFCELAQRLRSELDLKVIMAGSSAQELKINDSIIDMVNKTTLPELTVLLKRGSLLISADSGPVHLAACVATPVMALFRNDLPGKTAHRWGPWGSGNVVIEKSSLFDITVDEVFTQVKEKLEL